MTNEQLWDLIKAELGRIDAKIDQVDAKVDGAVNFLSKKIDDVAAGVRALNTDMTDLRGGRGQAKKRGAA